MLGAESTEHTGYIQALQLRSSLPLLRSRWPQFFLYLRLSKVHKFFRTIPGAPGNFLLGNAWEMRTTINVLPELQRHLDGFGPTVKLQIGPIRKFLFTIDYELIEFLLANNKVLNKSENYKFLEPWLGTGLLNSDGPKWKVHRKIITPAFHFEILKKYVDIFETVGDTLIEKLEKICSGSSSTFLDIYPLITLCALDVICESAMGTKINAQDNEESEYVKSVQEMARIIIKRGIHPLKQYDITYPLTGDYYTQGRCIKVLHRYSNSVLSSKMAAIDDGEGDDGNPREDVDRTIKKKMAFLDLLLRSREARAALGTDEIREEVDTFMFEGHDTTASATSFVLYCLAKHPEVQEKAYKEQTELFADGQPTTGITHEDLQKMQYLNLVIKETLRLFPSVPIIGRQTDTDVEFKGKIIPAGVNIGMVLYSLMRDPKFFENPEVFDPTRFERMDNSLPYSYIPFSAGSRNCIGQKFAVLEIKSTVSKILRSFELLPAVPHHELILSSETVLKSQNGIRIGLKRRG